MKNILSCLLIIFSISNVVAQNFSNSTPVSKNYSYDTTLTPDYYEIEITIAEYDSTNYKRSWRGSKYKRFSFLLDTLEKDLLLNLRKLGCHQTPIKTKLTNKTTTNSYGTSTDKQKYQAHYKLNIKNKDSVEFLFLNLKTRGRNTFIAKPVLDKNTVKRVTETFEKRAKDSMNTEYLNNPAIDTILNKQSYTNINYSTYPTYNFPTNNISEVNLEPIRIFATISKVWYVRYK